MIYSTLTTLRLSIRHVCGWLSVISLPILSGLTSFEFRLTSLSKVAFVQINLPRDVQPSNISVAYVKADRSKFEASRYVKFEQPSNILSICATLLVLKVERSSLNRDEQPSNIVSIFSTLLVSKLDRSSCVTEIQALNISAIFFTFFVLKLETSRL